MSESSLRRILKFAKENPQDPIAATKPRSGRPSKFSPAVKRDMRKKLHNDPTLTAKMLKQLIPELEDVKVRTIQNICKAKLGLPSRKMAKKPLLTDRMKPQRLEFARQYGKWEMEEWKKVMFLDESHFELRFGAAGGR
jgi:hypothetical protein